MTAIWSENWQSAEQRVRTIEGSLRAAGAVVVRGGPYDRWDLEVTGGMLGGARVRTAVEEHGQGRQMLLVRSWPSLSRIGASLGAVLTVLATTAAVDGAGIPAALLGAAAVVTAAAGFYECALSAGSLRLALGELVCKEEAAAEPGDLVAELTQLVPVAMNRNGGAPRPDESGLIEDERQPVLRRKG